MSIAPALPFADPPAAGGAMPGGRLLGLVGRMLRTCRAMAQGMNRIARERLSGVDLARLAPVGFNATSTHYLVVEAVSLTAALRQRLLAVVRPASALGLPKAERVPQGHACPTANLLPRGVAPASEDDYHDWLELARPWRMGPGGLAVARRAIEKLSDRQVLTRIGFLLRRAATALGSKADVERIAALEAAALALCPEPEPAADGMKDGVADPGKAGGAPGAQAAGPAADDEPEDGAEDDPPKRPPDG